MGFHAVWAAALLVRAARGEPLSGEVRRALDGARNASGTDRFVLVTFTNGGFVPLAQNLLCSARRWGLDERMVVLATHAGACSGLQHTRAVCVAINCSVCETPAAWGDAAYRGLTTAKLSAFAGVLDAGFSALFMDVDVVMAADPLPELRRAASLPADIVNMVNDPAAPGETSCPRRPSDANSGFFLVRAGPAATAVLHKALALLERGEAPYDGYDQGALAGALEAQAVGGEVAGAARLRQAFFDCEAVANGHNYFVHGGLGAGAAVVHANWIVGALSKEGCLRRAALWHVDAAGGCAAAGARRRAFRAELDTGGPPPLSVKRCVAIDADATEAGVAAVGGGAEGRGAEVVSFLALPAPSAAAEQRGAFGQLLNESAAQAGVGAGAVANRSAAERLAEQRARLRRFLPVAPDAALAREAPVALTVLACKRPAALRALLAALAAVGEHGGYVGHRVPLRVFIDVPRNAAAPPEAVVHLARAFEWRHGPKHVEVRGRHLGILGQWLSLRPADSEWFVVLEDDLGLSPCFYKYLLMARRSYGRRADLTGFTLQSVPLCFLDKGCNEPTYRPGVPTLNPIVGSWGFMPRPQSWRAFLEWQANATVRQQDPTERLPAGLHPSRWYRDLVSNNRTDTMWTIWHSAFAATFGLATLTPHFSAPLSYVHGSQPSEHGNPPDRRATAAAAAAMLALQPEAAPTEAPKLGGAAGEALPAELLFEDVLLDCAELLPACTREPSELPVYDFKGRLRNTSKS